VQAGPRSTVFLPATAHPHANPLNPIPIPRHLEGRRPKTRMPSTQPPAAPSPSSTTPTLQEMLIHAPFVRAVARAAVWGDQQVDDVVQATWLAALEKGPRHAASLKGWLATVTRNAARAMGRGDGRRAARERNAARPEALDSTAEIVAKEEIRRQLVEAVLGLRQPYRSVILLRYYEHLSPRAVAARLGIPRETARTQIKRGL
jgi:RNA polymerase sigma factor (sigma-70 family)